jgi:hypothetical protein
MLSHSILTHTYCGLIFYSITSKNQEKMKKKLLTVLISSVLLLGLGACSGDETGGGGGGGGGATYCYTCVSTTTWTGSSSTSPIIVTQEVCGLTEEGARNTEKAGTYTVTSSGGTVTNSTVMNCSRK